MYTRSGGFLQDIALFDSQFFGISPREAVSMDPQQRLLLEVCWEALEHAGQAPDKLAGSRTGLFAGLTTNDYMELRAADPGDLTYAIPGNLNNFAAGRVSYVLGLQGPCMAVDTACSSSLVTVHLACQSLRARECDAGAGLWRQRHHLAARNDSAVAHAGALARRPVQGVRCVG